MTLEELQAVIEGVAPAIKEYVARSTWSLEARIKDLEARELIRGEDGRDGRDGAKGDPGERGAIGEKGERGADGRDGVDGKDGAPGPQGQKGADGIGLIGPVGPIGSKGDAGEPGRPGDAGPMGIKGEPGLPGAPGDAGPIGPIGETGPSAYDIARKHGFSGDEVSWLASLHGKDGRDGMNGKDGAAGLNGKDGRDGVDGKDGAVGLNGKDGRDGTPGKDGASGLHGKDGRDGTDVDMGLVRASLADLVTKAVAQIPAPKDGSSVTVDDVAPLIERETQRRVDALPRAKDGIGITGALIDREGALVLTLSDGSTKSVGVVTGKDGLDGVQGKDADHDAITKALVAEIHAWPRPKDGNPGRDGVDGRDGLGFEDLSLDFDEAKGYRLVFARGDLRKEFPIAQPYHAGIWQAGRNYVKGANVIAKGSTWIAMEDTNGAMPGESAPESRVWRLAVKRGADGKPGRDGRDGSES